MGPSCATCEQRELAGSLNSTDPSLADRYSNTCLQLPDTVQCIHLTAGQCRHFKVPKEKRGCGSLKTTCHNHERKELKVKELSENQSALTDITQRILYLEQKGRLGIRTVVQHMWPQACCKKTVTGNRACTCAHTHMCAHTHTNTHPT